MSQHALVVKIRWITMCAMVLSFTALFNCTQESKPQPPDVRAEPKTLTAHGHERVDEYYWLNQRENPDVIAYLEAENAYLDKVMAHTAKLQKTLYQEIVNRIPKDDSSVPVLDNGYYYYDRYESGKEYPIYCRKKGDLNAAEEVILDVNQLAQGHDYFQVRGISVSPNNQLLAFGVDTVSRRQYVVHVKDLKSGKILPDRIANTSPGYVWSADNRHVFYTSKDSTLRPHKVMLHRIGEQPGNDRLVHHESDNTYLVYAYKSKSGRFVMIVSYSTLSTEMRFVEAANPTARPVVIQPRQANLEYSVAHFGDKFYVLTNHKAKNFRLMETAVKRPQMANWKEVIAHRDEVLLQDIDIFSNYLVVSERKDGLRQLRVINQKSGQEHHIDFGEAAYWVQTSENPEFETVKLRFEYSSMTTPKSTYDYDMTARSKRLLKRQEILGDFDPANYQVERLYAEARDGVRVPISLVYRKGTEKNGQNPMLLYAYGSYGSSTEARFSSSRLSLLDRGFVYAIAHIRGGEEMGRQWYEDGKLLKKKNTFTDFIDCGDYLISQKFTNSEKLFCYGGSAGGLLIGAVVNMRPDLFKGAVAAVPFVDVVTTMLDETIPLTTGEFDEWGNPKIKEYYDYMLSYSPYDNVEAKDYPAMLVTTGLHDSQVQYWEPAKWVARLRDKKTDRNRLLFSTQMEAGHSGASGRFERYKKTALTYAFLLDQAGLVQGD